MEKHQVMASRAAFRAGQVAQPARYIAPPGTKGVVGGPLPGRCRA